MKYAIQYNSTFRYMSEVDEIIFIYTKENIGHLNQISSIITKGQTAILQLEGLAEDDITEDFFVDLLKLKTDVDDNLIIMIDFEDKDLLNKLKDYNFKILFKNYARSKEMIEAMGAAGAYGVYIVEELAFNLKDLQFLREKYHLQYRIFPNIAQSTKGTGSYLPPLSKFFVRPEDVSQYETYVDVFEIFNAGDRNSVLYEIYKKEQWLGNLNDIILGLVPEDDDKKFDNTTIAPHFGQMRVDCNKICLCGRCYICEEIGKLAEQFGIAGLEIVKKKKKVQRSEEEVAAAMKELKEHINESKINGNVDGG